MLVARVPDARGDLGGTHRWAASEEERRRVNEHPYQPPVAVGPSPGPLAGVSDAAPTPAMLDELRRMRPWMVFLGVLGLIGAGLLLLGGLGVLVSALALDAFPGFDQLPRGVLYGVGGFYVLGAVLYVLPARRLLQSSAAILLVLAAPSPRGLEQALAAQRSFWRTLGVLVICGIVLSVVGYVAIFAAAVSGAAHMTQAAP